MKIEKISAISFAKHIQKWLAAGVAIFAFIAGFMLIHRFEVIEVPVDLQKEGIFAGSSLLVDWNYRHGRALAAGDRILYGGENTRVKLGKINAVGDEKNSSSNKHYLIASSSENKNFWLEENQIRGRVLMVWTNTRAAPAQKNFTD